jgi:hypothetical protein
MAVTMDGVIRRGDVPSWNEILHNYVSSSNLPDRWESLSASACLSQSTKNFISWHCVTGSKRRIVLAVRGFEPVSKGLYVEMSESVSKEWRSPSQKYLVRDIVMSWCRAPVTVLSMSDSYGMETWPRSSYVQYVFFTLLILWVMTSCSLVGETYCHVIEWL